MKRTTKRTTNSTPATHESDGKFALQLNSQTAVQPDGSAARHSPPSRA